MVVGFFSRMLGAVALGAILLVMDLLLVQRAEYESPWRTLLKASPVEKSVVIGILILLLAVPLFAGISPTLLRSYIRSHGTQGQGVIQRKIPQGLLPAHIFEISYLTDGGQQLNGRSYWIPRIVYKRARVGQMLPIHYLPQHPRWFILDELLPENGTYYLSLFLSFILFALWFALRIALHL